MGFKDDGDPPTGNPGVVEDSVEDGMDTEETTVPVVRKSVEKSGRRTSLSRFAHTSTSRKYKSQVASRKSQVASTSTSTSTSTRTRTRTGTRTRTKTRTTTRTMGNQLE
jgi:hypothetical protein